MLTSAVAAAAGVIAYAIRYAASRITTALDLNTAQMLKKVESDTRIETKIDVVHAFVEARSPPMVRPAPNGA